MNVVKVNFIQLIFQRPSSPLTNAIAQIHATINGQISAVVLEDPANSIRSGQYRGGPGYSFFDLVATGNVGATINITMRVYSKPKLELELAHKPPHHPKPPCHCPPPHASSRPPRPTRPTEGPSTESSEGDSQESGETEESEESTKALNFDE